MGPHPPHQIKNSVASAPEFRHGSATGSRTRYYNQQQPYRQYLFLYLEKDGT